MTTLPRRPDFFIIGAPKCGTTALSEYLREHPNIFITKPKEPHYFATDFPNHRYVTGLDDYLALFRDARPEQYMLGEASVWYLYSREALLHIREFNPDAKIIAMLRNPVDLVHALHAEALHTTDENEQDFERAWALQDDRLAGRGLPRNCRTPAVLQYRKVGLLGEQVERLLAVFPRSQVKLIVFDDFKRNPRQIYEETLSFLGVPPDGRTDFPVINANQQRRSHWFAELLIRKPPALRVLWRIGKSLLGKYKHISNDAFKWFDRINSSARPRAPLDAGVRARIEEYFRADVQRLASLLGRDLSHWATRLPERVRARQI